ncbi:MAG: hypothetical protein Q9227_003534 [Pyrenula ochraceoflavens]
MSSTNTTSPRFLIIGAGSRGSAYAKAVLSTTNGVIAAVAEPDPFKRKEFGQKYIWGLREVFEPSPDESFVGWEEWVERETNRLANGTKRSVDGVFICTLDHTHADIVRAVVPLGVHMMCEKPLALSLSDCLSIQACLKQSPPDISSQHSSDSDAASLTTPQSSTEVTSQATKIFSIGHVLRYSPHNIILRRLLLQDRAIGSVVSLEHTEPIGWWHFSHSYVRGNWRRATPEGVGSLLTKSCHDIDFIMWLLCSPADSDSAQPPHLPSTVTSSGHLTHFKRARKPIKAGDATNCLACPAEPECNFSAKKIYRDRWLRKEQDTGWPLKIVVPEIEDIVRDSGWDKAEQVLLEKLGEDYDRNSITDQALAAKNFFGRCVYESDNNVVDTQSVTITWDEEPGNTDIYRGPKTAIFNMTYPTQAQCERRGHIYGTAGEISYDSRSITVYKFAEDKAVQYPIPKQSPEELKSHGGGDFGLAKGFVQAVDAVENGVMNVDKAQRKFVGCTLEECVVSHGIVFAAEEARMERKVVDWQAWWEQKRRILEKVSK